MTHAQQLRELADKADAGRIGPHNVADEMRRIADELEALKAREPKEPEQVCDGKNQQWAGMDGVTAFQLIERHADGWDDIGQMMGAWLAANSKAREPMTPNQVDALIKEITGWSPPIPDNAYKLVRGVEAHHNITSKE